MKSCQTAELSADLMALEPRLSFENIGFFCLFGFSLEKALFLGMGA